MVNLVDGQQRDAQLARLRLGRLGRRNRLQFHALLDQLAHCIDCVKRRGTSAEAKGHAIFYILRSLFAGNLFLIHSSLPPNLFMMRYGNAGAAALPKQPPPAQDLFFYYSMSDMEKQAASNVMLSLLY